MRTIFILYNHKEPQKHSAESWDHTTGSTLVSPNSQIPTPSGGAEYFCANVFNARNTATALLSVNS